MADTVREIMTSRPAVLPASDTVAVAAREMRDRGIGDILVVDDDRLRGILTDRDIVVRAIAESRDPKEVHLSEICSSELTTIDADTPIRDAVRLMREKALRRLPVVDHGHPVGIVSLGDLALERDPSSVLADISAASPNT